MSPVSRRADANLTYPACRSTSTLWQGCSSSCTCGLGANITGYGGTTANSRLHHLAALERSAAHGCGRRGCASVADLVRGARLATDPHAKRCALVFVGDSLSLQVYDAAACSLQAGGAEEHRPLRDSFSALRYLSTHPRLANVTEYYSAPENWPQWRQHTGHRFRNILGETHERYLRLPRDDGGGDVEIHMMLLWRWASSKVGPGGALAAHPGVPTLYEELMQRLPRCTLTIYNEGLHAGVDSPSHYRSSVAEALDVFERVASGRRSGPHAVDDLRRPTTFAWETVAQHFDTPGGDGEFEHRKRREHGAANDSTAMYYLTGEWRRPQAECVDTPTPRVDWRDEIMAEEVETRPGVRLLPFHNASQAWGRLLHTSAGDCTHARCFTPFFFAPLWEAAARALA